MWTTKISNTLSRATYHLSARSSTTSKGASLTAAGGARRSFAFQGVPSLKGRHLMSIDDLTNDELKALLALSAQLKASYKHQNNPSSPRPLAGKSISMIFQKRSTRTRVSTETGMCLLGGHALFLGPQDIQLGINETLRDTANVLSRFNSLILARVFGHRDVQTLAQYSKVPVINALSDLHHPLQALADLLTLQEHFGEVEGKTLAWVGDGNNVLHDLALAAARMGMNVKVACPKGYDPDGEIMASVRKHTQTHSRTLTMTRQPLEAVSGADVVVTDTWVSMGQEEEYEKRVADFEGYQVNDSLMSKANKGAVFLHCLPRHEEEVADEVFYDTERSLVFPEAENRMWTVMAVMLSMLGGSGGK